MSNNIILTNYNFQLIMKISVNNIIRRNEENDSFQLILNKAISISDVI
jgi:hypothetical protein